MGKEKILEPVAFFLKFAMVQFYTEETCFSTEFKDKNMKFIAHVTV